MSLHFIFLAFSFILWFEVFYTVYETKTTLTNFWLENYKSLDYLMFINPDTNIFTLIALTILTICLILFNEVYK